MKLEIPGVQMIQVLLKLLKTTSYSGDIKKKQLTMYHFLDRISTVALVVVINDSFFLIS